MSKLKQLRFVKSANADAAIIKKYGATGGLVTRMLDFTQTYDLQVPTGQKGAVKRLERFDDIQEAQRTFWEKLREIALQYMKAAKVASEDIESGRALLSARDQPDFIERIAAERMELVRECETPSSLAKQAGNVSLSEVQTRWGSTDLVSLNLAKDSLKVKRRPDTSSYSVQDQVIETGAKPEPEPLPPVSVRQQSYIILRGMFSSEPSTKMIEWDTFINAMSEAGFSAKHSSGSAVNFEVDDWKRGWVGKIVFHKPHPLAKIDPIMLRSMGRRMARWFGWNRNTFAVK